jgi:hypothetical protein
VDDITIKGTKGLVNCQIFMHPIYFENESHITFKWYKYNIFCIMFIYSWSCHPMNLRSFHYVMKVLLHMQRTCWQVLKTTIKYECAFLLFKPSPNAFKFCMSFNILHKKWAMCPIIQTYFYMLVWKPFYMIG